MVRGSPQSGRAEPRVTTRPSCSQLVSTTTSVVCPATKLGPRPIVSGASPRCASGQSRFRMRASTSMAGETSLRTRVKSPVTTGTTVLWARIAGTAAGLVHANRFDSVQDRPAIEDRVGERHAATRGGRLLTVVNGDGMAGDEEPVRDGRADVADPADQSAHEMTLARIASFGISGRWPVVALILGGGEHQDARHEGDQLGAESACHEGQRSRI